jgi:uncharacterized membrane protein
MQEFINFFGHGFCHQIPARTLEAGGYFFSVCARDTGIYLGFAFALIAAFIIYATAKQKPGNIPPWPYLILLTLMVVPMALDGVSSYVGLRETTNTIRYITGALTGCAAGSIVAPLLFSLAKTGNPQKKILATPKEVALHLAITFTLLAVFFFVYPSLGVVSPLLVIAAFLVILASINLILITLSKRFAPRHTAVHWVMLLTIALALALIEITAFGALREAAEQFLLGDLNISDILK